MAFRKLSPDPFDTPGVLANKNAALLALSMGLYGVDVYTSGTNTGNWGVLHAVAESEVTVIRDGVSATLTIVAGDRIYGRITSITVTSGTVEAYRAQQ